MATKERNKLSGVKQAELEIRQEEEEHNATLEAEMLKDAQKRAEKAKKEAKEKAKHTSSDGVTNAPTIESIPPVEK